MRHQQQKKQPPPIVELQGIPPGRAGTRATLRKMAKFIERDKLDPVIRAKALQIVQFLPGKKWEAEARAIHKFVRDGIRYVRDIEGVETLHDAANVLRIGQGDCDDKVILAGALLQSIGHPVRLVAVGFNGGPLSHVLLETLMGNRWTPMELTEQLPFGMGPPGVTSKMVQPVALSR